MESLMELAIYIFGPYLELFTLAILSLVVIFFIIITVIFKKSPRKHIYYAILNLTLITFVLFETIYCRSVTAYANYILLKNNYEENNTIKRNIDRIKQLEGEIQKLNDKNIESIKLLNQKDVLLNIATKPTQTFLSGLESRELVDTKIINNLKKDW